MKNLLVNYAAGICPQGNVDFGMSFFEDGKERGQNSRRRSIGSTDLQRTALLLCGAVEIAVIDLIELGQDRLDVSEELIALVCKFDPFACRVKRRSLKFSSRAFGCLEREGWLTCSMLAALVTFRCFATAAKAVNCVNVIANLLGDHGVIP
jgi:hypothetical protein